MDKDLFKAILTKLKLTTGGSREINNAGQEKITGWLFLLASAGTIVLVSNTPLGIEEIKKISFSSIIGADKNDVKLLIFLLIIQLILIIPFINTLLLVFTDRNYALTRGIPATFIEFVFAIVMGIILGTTLKISGSLYSFGALILPPLIAINLTNKTKLIFILSPIIALVGAFLGFSLGSFYNIPQPQLTIFIFALFFPIALLYKSLFLRK